MASWQETLDGRDWEHENVEVANLVVDLYPHQSLAVAWMIMREYRGRSPRGGILADAMV